MAEAGYLGKISLPDEIKRREDRLAAIATAKAKIEGRAQVRYEQEQAEHEAKLAARAKKEAETGKKLGSKPRSRNWRNPITDLMMPNTGSTVCLRNRGHSSDRSTPKSAGQSIPGSRPRTKPLAR